VIVNSNYKSINPIFAIAFIVIVVSDDTLWFGTNANPVFITLKYVILLSALACIFVANLNSLSLKKVHVPAIICGLMCLLILTTGIVNSDLRSGYYYKCVILIMSYLIARQYRFEDFAVCFEKIIYFFAVVSVVFTAIASINRSLLSIFPTFVNSAGTRFYNLIVYMVPVSTSLARNYGIFREPGIFQMFLMIGLLFHTYYSKEFKILKLIIYSLAVILTYSTTGYIALIVYMILYLVKGNEKISDNKKKLIAVILMIGGLAFLALQTNLLSSEGIVFDKLGNMRRHTTIARFSSIFANIDMWLKKPLTGIGLTEVELMFPQISFQRYGFASTHNTNTLLCELSTFGIIYFLLFTNGYIKLIKKIGNNNIERMMVGLIVLILLFAEKLTFSPLIYILMFFGYFGKKELIASNNGGLTYEKDSFN
jgi:hypothetical protein